MNNRDIMGVIATAAVVLSACAPMEQAPLIYSSAVKGGINITTTPSATSALDISIGYSALDTAYVPVEVAKHCQSTNPADCNSELYLPTAVRGDNKVDSSVRPSLADLQTLTDADTAADQQLLAAKSTLASVQSKQATDQKLLDAVTTSQANVKADNDAIVAVQAKLVATPTDPLLTKDVGDARTKLATDTLTQNAAIKNAMGIDSNADAQAVQTALTNVTNATTKKSATSGALQYARDSGVNQSNLTSKGDALSVFGSFNNSTQGGVTSSTQASASLTLGKIFSTGVAAQIISESAAISATATCLSNATAAANLITDPSKKQDILTQAMLACSSRQ